MITEAFFLVAGFELEGYDEFIGSRCDVRAEQIVAQNHNCSKGEGFIRQIFLGLALALSNTKSLFHMLLENNRCNEIGEQGHTELISSEAYQITTLKACITLKIQSLAQSICTHYSCFEYQGWLVTLKKIGHPAF